MSSPQSGGGQKKGIYKRFRFSWFHVKVMTLTLIFFNQSTTLKEIRLHRKFQVNPTFCSEDINDFDFQGHMLRWWPWPYFFVINLLLLRWSAYTANFKSMQHFVPKIQKISVFKVTCQGHDLDLNIFFNQSIAFKEIRLPTQQISS